MARGTTLLELREMLRAEIGASSSVAMGVNTLNQYDHLLRRVQQRLWTEYEWEFAVIRRDEPLIAGERYYAFDDDIDFDRITKAEVRWNEKWQDVCYGIGGPEYNSQDSDAGAVNDPVLKWRHHEGNQFEVWPVPATSGSVLRFEAIRRLPPLIAPDDTAFLDDNLIVLFAAAELLARSKASDAPAKLQYAKEHLNRLKGQSLKNDRIVYGGGASHGQRIRYIGGRAVREDSI